MSTKGTRKTYAIKWTRSMCWHSLTTISRHQHVQKIMRVCISYTHLYPNKFLNHTLPSRICKTCFWNMQVASTLWPDIKSQKISERRFRLKWTKCRPRTNPNEVNTGQPQHGSDKEARTACQKKLGAVGGPDRPTDLPDRPTWPVGPTASTRACGSSPLVL